MPTVGEDCSVILDGHGYFVKPGSYRVEIPKVLAATPGAAAGPAAVDLGAGKAGLALHCARIRQPPQSQRHN